MTTTDDITDSLAVRDRLNTMSMVRDLLGDETPLEQLQAITQFVLTGRTPIDPVALTRAATAMAEEDGHVWTGLSDSAAVGRTYTPRALVAITTYLTPTT